VIWQDLAVMSGTVALMVTVRLFGIVPLPVGVIAHEAPPPRGLPEQPAQIPATNAT